MSGSNHSTNKIWIQQKNRQNIKYKISEQDYQILHKVGFRVRRVISNLTRYSFILVVISTFHPVV